MLVCITCTNITHGILSFSSGEYINSPIDYIDIENVREPVQDPIEVKHRIGHLLTNTGNDHCCDCHDAPIPLWVLVVKLNKIALNHQGPSNPLTHPIRYFILFTYLSSGVV